MNTVGAIAARFAYSLASGLRAEDQVGFRRLDRAQVGVGAGAHTRQLVNNGAQVGRLVRGAVRERGPDDARLQTQCAQRVELVAREHDDALRVVGHLRSVGLDARGVVGDSRRCGGIQAGRFGCHDSSGRRWLPSTPAPAIWVVLVITDVDGAPPPLGDPEVQPLHAALTITAVIALLSAGPIP